MAFIALILNAATTNMMYSYLKARIQAHRQYITALHVCVRVQSGAPGCSTASVCTHQPAFIRPVRMMVQTEAQQPGVPAPSWPSHQL